MNSTADTLTNTLKNEKHKTLTVSPRPFKRIKILDSLRGLAALIVVIHHIHKLATTEIGQYLSPNLLSALVWVADRHVEAVLFFFMLSGFSIGLSLKADMLQTRKSINEYLYRRAKRILPLYWCALVVGVMIVVLLPRIYNISYSPLNLLGNLLFLQTADIPNAWFIPYGDNGPLWSLSYEVFYYLIAILIIRRRSKHSTNASIFLLSYVLLALGMIFINHQYPNPFSAFLTLLPIWLIGYEFSQYYLQQTKTWVYLYLLAAIYVILYVLHTFYLPSATLLVLYKGVFLSAVALLAYITFKHVNTHNRYVSFCHNLFNFIFYKFGQASYSIYIFHYIFLNLAAYFKLALVPQLIGVSLLFVACYHFEQWIIRQPFSFFKKNYV